MEVYGKTGLGPAVALSGPRCVRHSKNWNISRGLLLCFKDIYFMIYGIISEFTDKGKFHYLTKLKGPQVGNYLYTTQFLLLR